MGKSGIEPNEDVVDGRLELEAPPGPGVLGSPGERRMFPWLHVGCMICSRGSSGSEETVDRKTGAERSGTLDASRIVAGPLGRSGCRGGVSIVGETGAGGEWLGGVFLRLRTGDIVAGDTVALPSRLPLSGHCGDDCVGCERGAFGGEPPSRGKPCCARSRAALTEPLAMSYWPFDEPRQRSEMLSCSENHEAQRRMG